MKFGKILRSTIDSRMPQWRDHMVGYKLLKQAIKQQLAQGTHGSRPEEVSAAFTGLIDQHVEVVNDFYQERIEEGVIILHALNQHVEQIRAGNARPELRPACQKSLVQLHFQLLLLQNFVALNFTAVAKILKKFEKKFAIEIKNEYIGALVELPFYRCDALGELVEETERQFNALNSARAPPPTAQHPPMPPPPLPAANTPVSALAPMSAAASMPPPPALSPKGLAPSGVSAGCHPSQLGVAADPGLAQMAAR